MEDGDGNAPPSPAAAGTSATTPDSVRGGGQTFGWKFASSSGDGVGQASSSLVSATKGGQDSPTVGAGRGSSPLQGASPAAAAGSAAGVLLANGEGRLGGGAGCDAGSLSSAALGGAFLVETTCHVYV